MLVVPVGVQPFVPREFHHGFVRIRVRLHMADGTVAQVVEGNLLLFKPRNAFARPVPGVAYRLGVDHLARPWSREQESGWIVRHECSKVQVQRLADEPRYRWMPDASGALGFVDQHLLMAFARFRILRTVFLRRPHDVKHALRKVVLEPHVPSLQPVHLSRPEPHDPGQVDHHREPLRHGMIQRIQLFHTDIHVPKTSRRFVHADVHRIGFEQSGSVLVQFPLARIPEDLTQQHICLVLDGGTLAGLAHPHGVGPLLDVPRTDASHRLVA